ncbi:MAG: PTS transporter subunit IIC [Fusobacteriaceae bacterium]
MKRYFIDVLSYMALGLFSSLLIGTILNTLGQKLEIKFLTETVWPLARDMTGASIGVAVSYSLKAPPLVLFASVITGAAGNVVGGPVGALIASVIGAEFGKAISKETKVDIILTPAITVITGILAGGVVGPFIADSTSNLGELIMYLTELQPFYMGIFISVIMGMLLTLPLSSAAISIMLSLGGIAGGAATVGCSAQMIGFAFMSYKENGLGGFFAQGFGTSMIQISNIIKNYKIWIPPIITSALLGPLATVVFRLKNIPISSGMGSSGLVGQIGTVAAMEGSELTGIKLYFVIFLLHILLPGLITYIIGEWFRKIGWIKDGDLKIDI